MGAINSEMYLFFAEMSCSNIPWNMHAHLHVSPLFGTSHILSRILQKKLFIQVPPMNCFQRLTLSIQRLQFGSANKNSLLRYCGIPGIRYISVFYIVSVHDRRFQNLVSGFLIGYPKVHPGAILMRQLTDHSIGKVYELILIRLQRIKSLPG